MYEFECEEDKIEAFKENSTITKEGLLERISEMLVLAETDQDQSLFKKHSASFRKLYIDLLRKFRGEVEKLKLFKELEPYWSYSIDIDESGAVLYLSYADSVDFDDDCVITCIMTGQEYELLRVRTRLLTVEEYAEVYGVTVSAVRQWIRRGKLRAAVKAGNEWRIPELSEVNSRGYKSGLYRFSAHLSDIPEEYEFLKDYMSVQIWQSSKDKTKYIARLSGSKKSDMMLDMTTKEREKFELFLISHPLIKASSELFASYG